MEMDVRCAVQAIATARDAPQRDGPPGRDWISCIDEPGVGESSNPHPRSGFGRSECDPIRIRPRSLDLKAEQRDQIVSENDRDVKFAGLIVGQLPALIGIRIRAVVWIKCLLPKQNLTSSKRKRA